MVIKGNKKKVLKDVIKYYVDTTGSAYEDFISNLSSINILTSDKDLSYDVWLARECMTLLKQNDISLADCIENKDILHSSIKEDKSRNEGEFYTPEVWCKEGRRYLKEMLGDLWGEAYIWDASCGTANLLKTSDYPQDKIFMSTLLNEDVPIAKSVLPDATVFQLDFLNGVDNKYLEDYAFSSQLPDKLIDVLKSNKPLVFYMNPPYKVMKTDNTEIGRLMGTKTTSDYLDYLDENDTSLKKCALDIFHQFIFRILLLRRDYNLTNLYLGVFGPVTMFHSKMLEPLYKILKNDFVFNDGMCFSANDFANTSDSFSWMIGYTCWRPKTSGDKDKPVVLTAKVADADGNISVIGDRLINYVDERLHDWCQCKLLGLTSGYKMMPVCTSIFNFTDKLDYDYDNAIGYMMSRSFADRAAQRACITSLPNSDAIPITEENFWKCVSSFGARRCYGVKANPFNNSQNFCKPNEDVEGYQQWLIDCLVLFLFDFDAQQCSYRNMDVNSMQFDKANKLFPISKDIVKSVVTDEVVLHDLETHSAENGMLLRIIDSVKGQFSEEASALFKWGIEFILNSYVDGRRKNHNYDYCLQAWDAGLRQFRMCQGYFTQVEEEKYTYLLAKLKDKLLNGVYKFGFLMDVANGLDTQESIISGECD